MENVYLGMFDYLHTQSHRIAFCELVIPCTAQLKDFAKKCNVANYCKKIKQLLEKIEENSKYTSNERRSVTFSVNDTDKIGAWENERKLAPPPLSKFYLSWRKVQDEQKIKAKADEISGDYDFIPKMAKAKTVKKNEGREFKGDILAEDSDESSEEASK